MHQVLFTHPAMLQRTRWLGFRVPRSQGLCLLFPLSHIPHILALSETLGVAGGGGRAVHCWGDPAAPVAPLHAAGGHGEQWESSPCSRAPGPCRQVWGGPSTHGEQLGSSPGDIRSWPAQESTSLRRWHCLPKVKSASRAAPGPQVPQLTASQRPEGSPASSQA